MLQVVVSAEVRLRERVQLVHRVQREDKTVSTIVQTVNIYRLDSTVGYTRKSSDCNKVREQGHT